MSLPRGMGYADRGQEPRSLQINFSNQPASQSQPQQVKFNPTQAYESRIGSSRHPDPLDEITGYPTSSAFSAPGSGQPLSPQGQPFTRIQVRAPPPPPTPPSPTPSCCCWVVSCVDSCRYIAKIGVLQPRTTSSSCLLVGLCHCVLCVDLFGLIAKIRSLTASMAILKLFVSRVVSLCVVNGLVQTCHRDKRVLQP